MTPGKRILIITPIPTHPVSDGYKSCIVSYSNLLQKMGNEVYLLYTHQYWATCNSEIDATKAHWGAHLFIHEQTLCDRIIQGAAHRVVFSLNGGYPLDVLYPRGLDSQISRLDKQINFDVILTNYWHLTKAFKNFSDRKKILFFLDRFGDRAKRTGVKWLSIPSHVEKRALERADVILSIQNSEAVYYRSLTDKTVLTSYSPFPQNKGEFSGQKRILFIGGPNAPNREGLQWFIKTVWPSIVERERKAELIIGGLICSAISDYADSPGVILKGKIEVLSDFYSLGDICINPVTTGTGLKIKTFDALSYGKAIICSRHSLDGIYREEHAPMMAADTEKEYVDAILDLFAHPDKVKAYMDASIQYIDSLNNEVEKCFHDALSDGCLQ